MEYYAAIKTMQIMSFAGTWMELEAMLSKLTLMENQIPHILPYKWEVSDESTRTQRGEQDTLGPIGAWRVRGGRGSGRTTNGH